MQFNGHLEVDFSKWSKVNMARENNMTEDKGSKEEMPKFGAGSEFGREAREKARRKKLGIADKEYRADDQPWILKSSGSTTKKFKGLREGGVSDYMSYYVFVQNEAGAIEAFPLQEWYKFQPIQQYKALSAEEAEMEFSKRDKNFNYFSLMMRKRLKDKDDTELNEEEEKGKKSTSRKKKGLKISEMDEWMDSSGDESSNAEEKEEGEESTEKKKPKKGKAKNKKKERDTNREAFEDSDDGDGESREVDYISDSTDSEPENINLDSVAEEKALRELLNSDEETDEDEDMSEESNENEENQDATKKKQEAEDKDKNKKKPKKDVKKEKDNKDDDDVLSSDSSTDEENKENKVENKVAKKEGNKVPNSANSPCSATSTDTKRKFINDILSSNSKKLKLKRSKHIPGSGESGITEDAVRKCLMKKPMTTTELLKKFKTKKTGLSRKQLVTIMTNILKKINPVKQTSKGKMYFSIKQ